MSNRPTPEQRQALVRMGKGQAQSMQPVKCGPYMPTSGRELWDPEQARLNREAGIA